MAGFSINESLWVCSGVRHREILYPRMEVAALQERGAKVFLFDGAEDSKGYEELVRLLRQSDVHVVLMWCRPGDMKALYPILRERKNFSIMTDDWWIVPNWFMREAEYVVHRMYNGIAVRRGYSKFVTYPPPLFVKPQTISPYAIAALALRPVALTLWPFVDIYKWFQRRGEKNRLERLLYFPYSVSPESLPLKAQEIKYDFALTGSTVGVWLMRDPFASFKYTYANLYDDRRQLMNLIAQFSEKPFKVYDWRKFPKGRPAGSWEDYLQLTQQSRYVLATGGCHNAGLPKHLEYACLGTPMIGRKLPFEYPWLDDCIFDVDLTGLTAKQMKPLLDEALARQPALHENCLKWRERLFKLYDPHSLFDMLQAQADGRPIPSDYLRRGVKQPLEAA
jgi:hypothetical protein